MVPKIGSRKPFKLFLAEWRESKHLTQEQLAQRIGKSDVTVSRWETAKRRPSDKLKAEIAEALGIELVDLFRHPDTPSADELLRDQPPEVVDYVFKTIHAVRR